jgi:hypothetical protein
MKSYKGACHCGAVQFEVQADFSSAIECNCSMCSKKGTILSFATPENFKLLSGESSLSTYNFYKNVIDHTFCKSCGVTPFLSGRDPSGNMMKAINLRCIEGIDLKVLEIKQVDGRSF